MECCTHLQSNWCTGPLVGEEAGGEDEADETVVDSSVPASLR